MTLRLTDLSKDETGIITGFDDTNPDLCTRLREIGFAEGDNVTPLHFGLFGKNPISVRVNGALIALRRQDAIAIKLKKTDESQTS
ncbi:MAG: FeoA family protein [Litorimonas sp.]